MPPAFPPNAGGNFCPELSLVDMTLKSGAVHWSIGHLKLVQAGLYQDPATMGSPGFASY